MEPWIRRAILVVLLIFVAFALANVFGQRSTSTGAHGADATLTVKAPARLRGGLLFQARFTIRARRKLDQPTLVLTPGWFQGMTLNTLVPDAMEQATMNGSVVLKYDSLDAGEQLIVWAQYQVNPTNVGRRTADVDLYDGSRRLVHVHRKLTIFP